MKTAAYLVFLIIYLITLFMYSAHNTVAVLANPLAAFGLVILGAYLSAYMADRAKLVMPKYYSSIYQSLVGGFLMGLGFIAAGLPQLSNTLVMVHGVFYWVSLLMPVGLLYLGAVFLGGGAATMLQRHLYPKLSFTVLPVQIQNNIGKWLGPVFMVLSFLMLFVCVQLVFTASVPWPGLAGVVLALLGGVLLERNRFCMGLMMKEIYFTRTINTLWKLAAVTLVLGIAWYVLDIRGYNIQAFNFWPVLAGSFLMGFGFVLADGCYMGSLWKAGQGNIASLLAVIGIFLGAGTAAAAQNFSFEVSSFSVPQANIAWPVTAVKIGLALFILIWVGAYLMERPEQVVKTGSRRIWLFSEASILLTLAIIIAGPKAEFSTAVLALGLVLYYTGIALYFWARINLGKYWGEAIVLRAGHKLVKQGPYRFVRHPIYLALTLSLTGLSLLLRSPWGLLGTCLLTVPPLVLLAREEERLLDDLPDERGRF